MLEVRRVRDDRLESLDIVHRVAEKFAVGGDDCLREVAKERVDDFFVEVYERPIHKPSDETHRIGQSRFSSYEASSELTAVLKSASGHTTTRRRAIRLSLFQARIPLHLDDSKQRLKRLQPSHSIRHAAQVFHARLGLEDRAQTLHSLGSFLDLVRGDLGQRLGECGIPRHVASRAVRMLSGHTRIGRVSDEANELYSR